MVLKTIQCCDRCGKTCEYESIYAKTGTQVGVDGMEDAEESVDLCPMCMRVAMDKMVQAMTHEQASEWVKLARTPMKVHRV